MLSGHGCDELFLESSGISCVAPSPKDKLMGWSGAQPRRSLRRGSM